MQKSRKNYAWAVVAGLVGALNLVTAKPAGADVVTEWNQHVITVGGAQIQRTLAMVHIAMFDAINAVDPQFASYLTLPSPPAGASAEAAAASAA